MAEIGTPAAIRPITGTATPCGAPSARVASGFTLPSEPSITLGANARRGAARPGATDSGSLTTSSARARCASRRMKPRSSSAVMSRWIPDFDRRSSASFISSKEGGTPASFSRSWINIRSSYCLRVSTLPPSDPKCRRVWNKTETSLHVPLMFGKRILNLEVDFHNVDDITGRCCRGKWRPDDQPLRLEQRRLHRAVLPGECGGRHGPVGRPFQPRPHVVLALVIGRERSLEPCLGEGLLGREAEQSVDERLEKDPGAQQGGDRIAGQTDDALPAGPGEHERLPRPHRDL